ncbi:glycosyl hydrolase family 17 protein [Flavobacterium sp.]|uniref:glycosyl hydrolase family 17 protein n=1 Tax=Flavobacterium sp. TaxID=239 RepID=UPI003BC6CF93
MKLRYKHIILLVVLSFFYANKIGSQTNNRSPKIKIVNAKDILGNPNYLALCYGGYRTNSREVQPSIDQIKEDLKIMSAMNIKLIRTYNVHFVEAANLLKSINELKKEDANFEMYVMLGAWIDCKNAWTDKILDHDIESERNPKEIQTAVELANQYPDIVKIIAVGNEAMVKWAENYYVQPKIILKWVNYLQDLKKKNKISKELWITSSDDFASWGGGDKIYHTKDLEDLIKAVDYVSMHTYPFHNTHYSSQFWKLPSNESLLSDIDKVKAAMARAQEFAETQYTNVKKYVNSVSPNKPIHIGETGWASSSDGFYGNEGSKASDEYKQGLYYKSMRNWSTKQGVSCFFFEAFDETWKDKANQNGSENHFGLFTVEGKAKYALWNQVDAEIFKSLKRDGNSIGKTFSGEEELLKKTVLIPSN